MTTTLTEQTGAAILRDIIDHPADDTPRLVYADWLEEYGDASQRARAEFIRVQIELEDEALDWRPLRERELSLFDALGREGLVGYGGPIDIFNLGINSAASFQWGAIHTAKPGETLAMLRRGFVETIRLPLAAFMEHAAALFTAHPVTAVTLTDRDPGGPGIVRAFGFFRRPERTVLNLDDLPGELWDVVREDPDAERDGNWLWFEDDDPEAGRRRALDALFRGCVRFGRDAAKKARQA